ncbi:MAG: hypothetical protein U0230_16055 [Polyangiales bacterium]
MRKLRLQAPLWLPLGLLALVACDEPAKPPVDGGGCSVLCSGATPFCDSASGTCVACTSSASCHSPTPTCAPATHTCVGCTSNDQCGDHAAPVCAPSTGACGGCTSDGDCGRFAATPVCDEASGHCVACTADTEATRCGGKACHPTRFECLTYARGAQDICFPCTADVECKTGSACIATTFDAQPAGSFCLFDQAAQACGDSDSTIIPYSWPAMATSVDGRTATYCFFPPTTTCQGVNEFRAPCMPGGPDTCGIDGVDGDAYCSPTKMKCTYGCLGAIDCKYAPMAPAAACGGAPSYCALP